jgi:glutamate/tyrosine decarboxylase-like PLP-dependent enzyme
VKQTAHTSADVSRSAVEAWFLGPKAENADEFERLLLEAFRDHVFWRRNFHPDDPIQITEEHKRSPEYLAALGTLKDEFRILLGALKKSVPFFSMRYQGHMNWDLTMASVLGYFATMLYNPNNVAFEASTATTLMEIAVGDDLCRMLGYQVSAKPVPGATRAWGHITADGTIANLEAVWAARNLKFLPISIRAALREDSTLAAARAMRVRLPDGGEAEIASASSWTLLNLDVDEILALPSRLGEEYELGREVLTAALRQTSVQDLGMHDFAARWLPDLEKAPVFLATGTKHYSWPKAAAILGIGASNLINVPVDVNARMDVAALRKILDRCLSEKRPVYTVVAVIGSTEESAVDPLEDVLALRDEYRARGLVFTVHADAAWGGYPSAMVRPDWEELPPGRPRSTGIPPSLSRYTQRQLESLERTDSVTLDPHKSGYIPYPAGALCYRNSAMRDLVTFAAPVVFHGEAEPTVGIYGVEGSKPGAAPAAVYLSHRVIPPSQSGYGDLHGQTLFSAEKLYTRLVTMFGPEDPFIVVPVSPLPKIQGKKGDNALQFLRERIDRRSFEEIMADPQARELIGELGPDLNILAYAFNFRTRTGDLNSDLSLANRLNRGVYDILSIDPGQDIYDYNLIVSTTEFDAADYGDDFIQNYKQRLGTAADPGRRVTILRSVVMDPWIDDPRRGGTFLDVLEQEFKKAVRAALAVLMPVAKGY